MRISFDNASSCMVSLRCASWCAIYVMPPSWTSYRKDYTRNTFSPDWSISSSDISWSCAVLVANDAFCESLGSRWFCNVDGTHCTRSSAPRCVRVDGHAKWKIVKNTFDKHRTDTGRRNRIEFPIENHKRISHKTKSLRELEKPGVLEWGAR